MFRFNECETKTDANVKREISLGGTYKHNGVEKRKGPCSQIQRT
jgi:hypothetical protein